MGLHSVTCDPKQVNMPCLNLSQRPVLNLPTLDGWKAELTYVTSYILVSDCSLFTSSIVLLGLLQ